MAPRAHARLSPSAASRWLRCPGSVNFIDSLDDPDEAGEMADQGSILHSFCEDCLLDGTNPLDLIGEEREHNGYKYALTEEDAENILDALDRIDEIPGKLFVERKLDLNQWLPGQFGTMDVGIASRKTKRAVVWDWKWGYLPVSPIENDQMRLYALGFWDNYLKRDYPEIEKFTLIIEQPRAPGGGGEWNVSLDDLLDFGKWAQKRGKMTYAEDAERIAGENQCQYCPGAKRRLCPEYDKFHTDMIAADFAEMDRRDKFGVAIKLPEIELLTPSRRTYIVKHRSMINKWLDRLQAHVMDDALKGRKTPGMKLVAGRKSPDRWLDEEAVDIRLSRVLPREIRYSKKLLSPSQASKRLSSAQMKGLSDLIIRGDRKPVLVDERDSKPRLKTIAEDFRDE